LDNAELLAGLAVDESAPVARYHQVLEGIRAKIESGRLRPGDRLPPVRALVKASGVSSATVVRALDELERQGYVVARRGVGTFVAERRIAATEILMPAVYGHGPKTEPLVEQVVSGVREGFGGGERRCFVSYLSHGEMTAEEILGVCRARAADSLVVMRPLPRLAAELRRVARSVATATLIYPPPSDSPIDFVKVDPAAVLRRLLRRRLEAGRRNFVFVSPIDIQEESIRDASPYSVMHRVFVETLREAGIEPVCHFGHGWGPAPVGEIRAAMGPLPDDAVLVAAYPHLAAWVEPPGAALDKIGYTEVLTTVEEFRGRATVLYAGADRMAQSAIELVRERLEGRYAGVGRTVCLEPEVFGED